MPDEAPSSRLKCPTDLFSGKALIYRPAENGFVLYSVGANGKDDGGRTYGEEPLGSDDIVIRIPQ